MGEKTEDLLNIQECRLVLVVSLLASIAKRKISKASPSVAAPRSAKIDFWLEICHNASMSHPKSCKKARLNTGKFSGDDISTYQ